MGYSVCLNENIFMQHLFFINVFSLVFPVNVEAIMLTFQSREHHSPENTISTNGQRILLTEAL